ncbi:UbiA family prenyltransferase [Candidatus Bathyarchaeota archaeon]|nr:UbiA family prenyltransferase [Candidatus Bathyarchaeota archaeon]
MVIRAIVRKLKAIIELMRPRHTAQIVGIVATFSILSYGFSTQALFAIVASLFASIAVFLLDDAHDYKSDKIAHPQRPIPMGLITVRQAYLAAAFLLFVGILLASRLLLHQFGMFIILIVVSMGVILLKLESILRAFLTAFAIWALLPFSASLDSKTALFGLILALPHIGGSITKDFLHSSGDRTQGIPPPTKWEKYVASSAFFLTGATVWLPTILGYVTWLYLPPISITGVASIALGTSTLKGDYQRVYAYGRIGMFSALIAFILGKM